MKLQTTQGSHSDSLAEAHIVATRAVAVVFIVDLLLGVPRCAGSIFSMRQTGPAPRMMMWT